MQCVQCGKGTKNPKFCSRSCSSSYFNARKPKRTAKVKSCPRCQSRFTGRNKFCSIKCSRVDWVDWEQRTLDEFFNHQGHRATVASRVREHARKVYFGANPSPACEKCGYDLHVQVCHIKGIQEYSEDTLVIVVNDLSNLIGLCPNHHWEFDHLDRNRFEDLLRGREEPDD